MCIILIHPNFYRNIWALDLSRKDLTAKQAFGLLEQIVANQDTLIASEPLNITWIDLSQSSLTDSFTGLSDLLAHEALKHLRYLNLSSSKIGSRNTELLQELGLEALGI